MITDNNIIMKLIQADTPRVISTEQLYVYVPVASSRTFGGVKPDGDDFVVDEDGVLYLRQKGGGTRVQYRGDWTPNTKYYSGDLVTYGGIFYYCIQEHTSTSIISPFFVAMYTLSQASSNALGGIKIGYVSAGRNYAVNLTDAGVAYVNVPWTDTTYALVTHTADGLMSKEDKIKLDDLENIQSIAITAPSTATEGVLTEEQVAILQANELNYIWFNGERFELMDARTSSGYVIYSHTGCDNQGNFYIKCIAIIMSTNSWSMESIKVNNQIESIIITAASSATSGTLTDDQVAILQANELNYIWFRGERYEAMGGGAVYTHYTHTSCNVSGDFTIKCLTIVFNAKTWKLDTINVGADIDIPYSDTTPSMDTAAGSAGTSTNVSRADHSHPSDTSKASAADLTSEIARATEAESDLSDAIDAEETRATEAEAELDEAISDETTRATTAETTIDNKLNYPFAQTIAITATNQVVTVTLSRRNIKSGATDTNSTTIPIADATKAGLMTPESVTNLQQLGTRVSALENTNIHLLYDEDLHPTPQDIRQFVINEGYDDPTEWTNIVVEVLGSTNVWKYFDAAHGWTEQVPTVSVATNSTLGIVQGSQTDGKIYVEDDGTMSVNGWNDLQDVILGMQNDIYDEEQRATAAEQALGTRMTTAEGNITSLGTRMTTAESDISDLNDTAEGLRDDLDSLDDDVSTLSTTVGQHTTSISSLNNTVAGHTTTISQHTTSISTLNSTVSQHDTSIAANTAAINSEVTNRTTAVTNEATARANADLAIKALLIGYTEVSE